MNKFDDLRKRARYKVYYGGRGAAKSHSFARALLHFTNQWPLRVLCAREIQSSIADSVHRLLSDHVDILGMTSRFTIQKTSIVNNYTGSEFLFKGLRHNIQEIKSTEGVDIAWVEEAQAVSDESWNILIPTIRKDGSEIWVSYNTGEEDDATHQRFVIHPPPGAIVHKVSWRDNPHFPKVLDDERKYLLSIDPDAYDHVWEGEPLKLSDACIFKGRYKVEPFETPTNARFFHGADWGFANDPTTLNRCFIKDDCLYIDQEARGIGVELDEIPELFDSIKTAREWPIKADNSRPETISYIRRKGFRLGPASKWPNSVEDGIAYLKKFRLIIIHERCKHTAQEFKLYSFKVDKKSVDPETGKACILPIVVDAHNHHIDGIRYALDDLIRNGGVDWENLI